MVTDIAMPVMDGIEASKRITNRFSYVKVIALSMHVEAEMIYDMFEAGAKGYLIKNTAPVEVVEAIETVYKGEMHYCSTSSVSLIKKIGPSKYNHYNKKNISFSNIEINIMKLICKQFITKEIADQLNMSIRTVEEYSHKIKEKIDARNMVGIALYAIKHNIVSLQEI